MYSIKYLVPEMLTAFSICYITFSSLFVCNKKVAVASYKVMFFTLFGCIAILLAYISLHINTKDSITHFNSIVYYSKLVLCIGVLLWLVLNKHELMQLQYINLFFLSLLILIFSIMGMLSTFNLLIILLFGEMYSLSFGIIVMCTSDLRAGIKYITISTIMSAIFLYGISIFYTYFGSLSIANINIKVLDISSHIMAAIFLLPYILFKINAVPFHSWIIDLYSKTKILIISLIDTVTKFAIFCFITYFMLETCKQHILFICNFLFIPAILSMLIGGITPIVVQDFKKFIAYSSIGHIGLAIAILSISGYKSFVYSLIYMFMYIISSFCFFIGVVKANRLSEINNINDLDTLSEKCPAYAGTIVAGLISMSSLPPFAIFLPKLGIFTYMIQTKNWVLLYTTILYSILTVCYTVRIIKHVYWKNRAKTGVCTSNGKITCAITIFILVIINVYFFSIKNSIAHMVLEQYIRHNIEQNIKLRDIYDVVKQTFIPDYSLIYNGKRK